MDTVNGIEYNNINDNRRVSGRIYSVDIARNPRIVKELNNRYVRMDVLGKADKVNLEREFVELKVGKIKGRS